jgi:hypothetical protein
MLTRAVSLVTGCDGSARSPGTAPQRLMPDMRRFSATPGPIGLGFSTFALFAFFLLWLRQCLPRKGMRQSGKVSKTVNPCVALLRNRSL